MPHRPPFNLSAIYNGFALHHRERVCAISLSRSLRPSAAITSRQLLHPRVSCQKRALSSLKKDGTSSDDTTAVAPAVNERNASQDASQAKENKKANLKIPKKVTGSPRRSRKRRGSRRAKGKSKSRSVGKFAADNARKVSASKTESVKQSGSSRTSWLRKLYAKASGTGKLEEVDGVLMIKPRMLHLDVVDVEAKPAPQLAFGLERVLFNPGVHHLRDLHSRVYNFDPWLEKIPDIKTFDFTTLNPFTPPSKDRKLLEITEAKRKKYFGSTSSMTGILKHFHFLLSNYRLLDLSQVSRRTKIPKDHFFTKITQCPEAVFLRRTSKGVYAIDADKMYDGPNVLSLMGTYMETFFTTSKEEFSRHLHGSENPIKRNERSGHDSFHYSTLNNLVIRSQLDAHDPRLPGTGIFDLKTRAVLPIRMSSSDYVWGMNYELNRTSGEFFSFEREFVDMCRSTMLKYSLQARMGRMDGIYIAYHNIARVFGFEYLSLQKLDEVLHGQEDTILGDQEFTASLELTNEIFEKATQHFPQETLRIHFDCQKTGLYVFVEPVTEDEVVAIQEKNKDRVLKFEASVLGFESLGDLIRDSSSPDSQGSGSRSGTSSNGGHEDPKVAPTVSAPNDIQRSSSPTTEVEQRQGSSGNLTTAWQTLRSYLTGSSSADPKLSDASNLDPLNNSPDHSESLRDKIPPGGFAFDLDDLDRFRIVEDSASSQTKTDQRPEKRETDEKSKDERRILGLKLIAASTINGTIVDRPEKLTSADKWDIHFQIKELGQAEALLSYQRTLTKRHRLLKSDLLDTDKAPDLFWMQLLRQKSNESKEWRKALDERDKRLGHDRQKYMWNNDIIYRD